MHGGWHYEDESSDAFFMRSGSASAEPAFKNSYRIQCAILRCWFVLGLCEKTGDTMKMSAVLNLGVD